MKQRAKALRYGVYVREGNGLRLAFKTSRYIDRATCAAQGYARCVLIWDGEQLPTAYENPFSLTSPNSARRLLAAKN